MLHLLHIFSNLSGAAYHLSDTYTKVKTITANRLAGLRKANAEILLSILSTVTLSILMYLAKDYAKLNYIHAHR